MRRVLYNEWDGLPLARLLCAANLHSRSKRHVYKVADEWRTQCRRCGCVMVREQQNGAWRKK